MKITNIDTRWRECWNITNEIIVNENVCLIQHKCMYRIYYTKDTIRKFYSTTAKSCLKCKTNNACLLGMLENPKDMGGVSVGTNAGRREASIGSAHLMDNRQ